MEDLMLLTEQDMYHLKLPIGIKNRILQWQAAQQQASSEKHGEYSGVAEDDYDETITVDDEEGRGNDHDLTPTGELMRDCFDVEQQIAGPQQEDSLHATTCLRKIIEDFGRIGEGTESQLYHVLKRFFDERREHELSFISHQADNRKRKVKPQQILSFGQCKSEAVDEQQVYGD